MQQPEDRVMVLIKGHMCRGAYVQLWTNMMMMMMIYPMETQIIHLSLAYLLEKLMAVKESDTDCVIESNKNIGYPVAMKQSLLIFGANHGLSVLTIQYYTVNCDYKVSSKLTA